MMATFVFIDDSWFGEYFRWGHGALPRAFAKAMVKGRTIRAGGFSRDVETAEKGFPSQKRRFGENDRETTPGNTQKTGSGLGGCPPGWILATITGRTATPARGRQRAAKSPAMLFAGLFVAV
jgi:hypothetical protein